MADCELPLIVWMPLADDPALHRDVVAQAAGFGCRRIQLSHHVCRDSEDLLDDPDRAARVRGLVRCYVAAGLPVSVWTHEVRRPPQDCVHGARLDFEHPGLWEHIEAKYNRFLDEVMPEIEGLVLTLAETEFPIYQPGRVLGGKSPAGRIARLAHALHAVCRARGRRLAVRDFVYRRSEMRAMIQAIGSLDLEVAVMSKCVPHDWHPFYPANPLLGRFAGREQWVEFDFGHEYEGQHLYPYAEVEGNLQRLQHAWSCGARVFVARLDRTPATGAQSALHTPWGRLELLVLQRFADDPSVGAEKIWDEWEADQFPGARLAVEQATRAVQCLLFPQSSWYADHSRLPTADYAATHLVGGNADRLAVWTGNPEHRERERWFRDMPAAWLHELDREAERGLELAHEAASIVRAARLPARWAERWRAGAVALEAWLDLFARHRQAYFRMACARQHPESVDPAAINDALQSLEHACFLAGPAFGDLMLENQPATAHFAPVLQSLRAMSRRLSRSVQST
jgi:hypothetical protein